MGLTEGNMEKGAGGGGAEAYERQSVACDVAIIVFADDRLQVLLIRRKRPPFAGRWALPGGFVERGETLAEAAAREVMEETGVRRPRLMEVGAFGDPGRDPRGRTISIAWLALSRFARLRPKAGDDAAEVGWFPLRHPPELAFDHDRILSAVRAQLRKTAVLTPDLFDLLPRRVSREAFRQLCREVMGRRFEADAFGRCLDAVPALAKVESAPGDTIYHFDRRRYRPCDFGFLLHDK